MSAALGSSVTGQAPVAVRTSHGMVAARRLVTVIPLSPVLVSVTCWPMKSPGSMRDHAVLGRVTVWAGGLLA